MKELCFTWEKMIIQEEKSGIPHTSVAVRQFLIALPLRKATLLAGAWRVRAAALLLSLERRGLAITDNPMPRTRGDSVQIPDRGR